MIECEEVMKEKMHSLLKNVCWDIIHPIEGHKIVPCKWI
jgi:hypothetical protein